MALVCPCNSACYSHNPCPSNDGYVCSSHESTHCPSHTNPPNIFPREKTSWTDPTLTNNILIKAVWSRELQSALVSERAIRSLSGISWRSVQSDSLMESADYQEIKSAIDQCRSRDTSKGLVSGSFNWSTNFNLGDFNYKVGIENLRNFVNILEQTCLCNTAACSCNSVISCSCNSVTPGCDCNAQCSCNGNCGCNGVWDCGCHTY